MPKNNGNLGRLDQSNRAKRVTLAEWRAKRVHELDLPSGLTVKVRDVDLADLVLLGEIPNTLLDLIGSSEVQTMSEQEMGTKLLGENAKDFGKMLNHTVKASLVEPAVGEVADDSHVTLDEFSFADKMEIFNWVNREAGAVRPFREGTTEPAKTTQSG